MNLDAGQTRRLFLAGTIPFPGPFPSIGTISFPAGSLTYSAGEAAKPKGLVVVQERARRDRIMVRVISQESVAAIFIPGRRNSSGKFKISRKSTVDDFERAEWFVDSDVNAETVRERLNLAKDDELATRDSILRGIVFVAQDAHVLSISEVTATAAAACDFDGPSTRCSWCRMTPEEEAYERGVCGWCTCCCWYH